MLLRCRLTVSSLMASLPAISVAAAFLDGRNDFYFARGESEAAAGGLPGSRPRGHRFAAYPELAFMDRANTLQQKLGGEAFSTIPLAPNCKALVTANG